MNIQESIKPPLEWIDEGNCAGNIEAGDALADTNAKKRHQAVLRYCSDCTVKLECLGYGLLPFNMENLQVFGGQDEKARAAIKKYDKRLARLAIQTLLDSSERYPK